MTESYLSRIGGLIRSGTAGIVGISVFNSGRVTVRDNDLVGDGAARRCAPCWPIDCKALPKLTPFESVRL